MKAYKAIECVLSTDEGDVAIKAGNIYAVSGEDERFFILYLGGYGMSTKYVHLSRVLILFLILSNCD